MSNSAKAGFFEKPFEELAAGDVLETPAHKVTEVDLLGFSALTGDWHPQHTDPVWAADGPFGERIAHGMLVLSLATGLLPLEPRWVMALRRVQDVVFKRPVAIGDSIRVRVAVATTSDLPGFYGTVRLRMRVLNQDDRAVAVGTLEALWRKHVVDCELSL